MKLISTKDSHSNGVSILMYGASGAGKTSLIKTLPNPFIISSENGLLSLADVDIPAAEIKTELDLKQAYDYAKSSDYNTICLDSISDIAESILAEYKGKFSDGRQAYGALGDLIGKYLRLFRDLDGKHVYITAKEGRTENSGVVTVAPSMPGQTLTINIPYLFDEVLRLEANKKGDRIIHTRASFTQVCKDRSNKLDKTEEADLGLLIKKISGEV